MAKKNTFQSWGDEFERLAATSLLGRAKPIRAWLEEQESFFIPADPFGYKFGSLPELITKAHLVAATGGISTPPQWLGHVFIRQGEGIECINRQATKSELIDWNRKYFSGLKPLHLGGPFDVETIGVYNEGLKGTGFAISENKGLGCYGDDGQKIIQKLAEAHRKLLFDSVISRALILCPPEGMESDTANEMKLEGDPSHMSRWKIDSAALATYLKTLTGNWELVGPSTLEGSVLADSPVLELENGRDYQLYDVALRWLRATHGLVLTEPHENPKTNSRLASEWAANESELWKAIRAGEFLLSARSIGANLNDRSIALNACVMAASIAAFLTKRGFDVRLVEPTTKNKPLAATATVSEQIDAILLGALPSELPQRPAPHEQAKRLVRLPPATQRVSYYSACLLTSNAIQPDAMAWYDGWKAKYYEPNQRRKAFDHLTDRELGFLRDCETDGVPQGALEGIHRTTLIDMAKAGELKLMDMESGAPYRLSATEIKFEFERGLNREHGNHGIGLSVAEFKKFCGALDISLVIKGEPEVDSVVEQSTTTSNETLVLKKAALITNLQHEWPSIEADLSEATRNGLNDAAKATGHGKWFESKARKWAIEKGKIRTLGVHVTQNTWRGPTTTNRVK
jgi:hypothetical protein